MHGNELLAGIMPDYPQDQRFKVTQHTLGNMARCLEMNFIHLPDGCDLPQGISKPIDLFVGYLLLDALIGNTDRHHENWGILERRVRPEKPRYAEVAPSFDHASSLGRELTEDKRAQLLESESVDTNVEAYARKARSAFYCQDSDKKPLSTVDAFAFLAKDFPTAACSWLDRLRAVSDNSLCRAVQGVPEERLTRASATFVQRMLRYNKERLLSV